MTPWESTYQQVCRELQEVQLLQTTQALLEWDQQTYLPQQGGAYRAEQVSFLAGEVHRRKSDPRLREKLQNLAHAPEFGSVSFEQQASVRELSRTIEKASRLPQRLVEELARACSLGQQVWVETRRAKKFGDFAPALERIVRLKREQATAYGMGGLAYDALLDDYEPGARSAEIAAMFAALVAELVPLLGEVKASKHHPDVSLLHRNFPKLAQEQLGRQAAQAIGFDFQRGRLDVTHHPFCTELGPHDCRILTRYDEQFFSTAFFGTLHEAGHGMYEQGLRSEYYGLPPGQYCSLGLHESQSRLWENLVGRSRGFWEHFWPEAVRLFPAALGASALEDFWRAINYSAPSLIRVEADEATYNLHVALRFELESALISGDLTVAELPAAWSDKYHAYLGLRPADDAEGALQDVHWSAGLFGYFPTYTLGTLYASQLFDAAERELGALESHFQRGQFQPLLEWLRRNVHRHGQTLTASEIVTRASHQPISQAPLLAHLRTKLRRVYRLEG
jgi:carboxypeptidase Taq